jgi:hypothetical protein
MGWQRLAGKSSGTRENVTLLALPNPFSGQAFPQGSHIGARFT